MTHFHLQCLYAFSSQRYRELLNQKEEAVASSRESLLAADSLGPVTETTTDCSDENSRFDDTGLVTNVNSKQAPITLTQLDTQTEEQQQKEQEGPGQTALDLATTTTTVTSTGSTDQDLHSKEEETTSQDSVVQERPAGSREEPDSEPGGAAEDANEGEEEEKETPAATGKKSGTGKAKTTKRRSGRANRR